VWDVVLVDEVERWFVDLCALDQGLAEAVTAAIDMLEQSGPSLGRPLVDRIKGARHHNMKELRVRSTRILFVFDPQQSAVLVVAGDKAGQWSSWYRQNVPIADDRYDTWLADREQRRSE
jgi:hypothetical protein